MALCDFSLFPKIKRTLKGHRFTNIDDIKSASLEELKAIPKIEFENCFRDWRKCWHKYIISSRDYFKGDNIDVDNKYFFLKKTLIPIIFLTHFVYYIKYASFLLVDC